MPGIRLRTLLSTAILIVCAHIASSQDAAYTIINTGNLWHDPNPYSFGMMFTTTQTLYLTDLGFANANGLSGFTFSHIVGIYDANDNLLVSTSLASGLSGHTVGSDNIFRYQDISYTLAPGKYLLASNTGGPEGLFRTDQGLTYTANSAVSFQDWTNSGNTPYLYYYYNGNQPADQLFPPLHHYDPTTLQAGPNFLFSLTPTGVPEASSIAIMALGLMSGTGLLLHRRQRELRLKSVPSV